MLSMGFKVTRDDVWDSVSLRLKTLWGKTVISCEHKSYT